MSAEKLLVDKGGFNENKSLEGQLENDFSKIEAGDIVVLFDQSGMIIHSFVNKENNKVSSKNGSLGINEFKDENKGVYTKDNATIDDVVNQYIEDDKQRGGNGIIRKGYFTPVDNKSVQTNNTEYQAPKNGTVEKKKKNK